MAQVHSDFFTFIIFLNYIQNFYFRFSKLISDITIACSLVAFAYCSASCTLFTFLGANLLSPIPDKTPYLTKKYTLGLA